jgi:hypothetical protein
MQRDAARLNRHCGEGKLTQMPLIDYFERALLLIRTDRSWSGTLQAPKDTP